MQKQAPTLGRLFVMVAFALSCFGLLLFLWLAFGGSIPLEPRGWRFEAQFSEATQLAKQADVRISGVPVGKVTDIQLARNGRSTVTIQLKRQYAPIPRDSRAILRQKTLLGETYVELTPGTPNSPKLKEGGMLPVGNVAPTVELDEIFRALDAKTRQSFQIWMQSLAEGTLGRGQSINDAFGTLSPLATDANQLLQILVSQTAAVQKLISNTGEVFTALSERDGQLSSLITNANKVFQTTANRNADLQALFVVLPTFERESRLTLRALTAFAHNTNPLVTQLRPAARQLSPLLIDLSRLAPDLKTFFVQLNPLITSSRTGLPALREFLRELPPLLGQLDPFTRQIIPIFTGLVFYKQEINAFFANTVAATQASEPNPNGRGLLHYLRTTNPINPENLAVQSHRLATNRPNAYQFPGAFSALGSGLNVYENRQCNGSNFLQPFSPSQIAGLPSTVAPVTGALPPVPVLGGLPSGATGAGPQIITQSLAQLINQFAFGGASSGSQVAAPPCKLQGDFPSQGQVPPGQPSTTHYPRVWAAGPP
jgi:phospholipid/cholesterol/gamma-HCH transport system substrate-binding protein